MERGFSGSDDGLVYRNPKAVKQISVSSTGGAGTIALDLTSQEQLILTANNIVIASTNLTSYIASVIQAIPELSSQGVFHDYIGSEGDLNHFILKAQELQTLTELIHQFATDTYSKFIDVDRLQALEIGNLILNISTPSTSSGPDTETAQQIAQAKEVITKDPQVFYDSYTQQSGGSQ